jgi:hypothetical protein
MIFFNYPEYYTKYEVRMLCRPKHECLHYAPWYASRKYTAEIHRETIRKTNTVLLVADKVFGCPSFVRSFLMREKRMLKVQ